MGELPVTNGAKSHFLLVCLLLILCAAVLGHSHDHNHSSAGQGAVRVPQEGGNSPPAVTGAAVAAGHVKKEPIGDAETAPQVSVTATHQGHQKFHRAKHHHHNPEIKKSGKKKHMIASQLSLIAVENYEGQHETHSDHLKSPLERKAHLESLKNHGSHRLRTKDSRKTPKVHQSFDFKESLVLPSSMSEKFRKHHQGLIMNEKKKIPSSKHSAATHHQHHRRKQHHKHAHHQHPERSDHHSSAKFPRQRQVLHGKAIDPLDVPELAGFVLQEFHEEDFEGERLYSGDSKSQMGDRQAVSGHLKRGDHFSIPADDALSGRKRKTPKKFKKILAKEKPIAQKDIKVEVKQFKDFDLTVLDVPSLSANVAAEPQHPHKDVMASDEPVSNKSSSHNTLDDRSFQLFKKRSNGAKMTVAKIDAPAQERHHIARRIGDGGDLKMMNPFGSILGSGLVKKLGDAETLEMTRDSEIIFEKPLKARKKSGKKHISATMGNLGAASRYRREEAAPGSTIGAAAAARPETAEPLDYEAANANPNTELDAEVDIGFADIDADVRADADAAADQSATSEVEDATATSSAELELFSTTFAPDVMPSISCSGDPQCSDVRDALCGTDGTCVCPDPTPVYVADIPGCLKGAALNTSCEYDEQCLYMEELYGRCGPKKICTCVQGYEVKMHPNVGINCVEHSRSVNPVDPTMIGVLVGLALMFIIICVVLRLFSKARFRENRSIFNTPNPRLMNASMFKDSKLLSPSRGDRRGSRASVRAPSRTASLASVNATSPINKSPNGSLTAKGRRGSGVSVGSGPVGSPPATALSRTSPAPETPKSGSATSPDKNKKDESAVNIEAVD